MTPQHGTCKAEVLRYALLRLLDASCTIVRCSEHEKLALGLSPLVADSSSILFTLNGEL